MPLGTGHIGVGILGCSDIAGRRFLPGLARSKSARLTAIASRDREKARSFLPGADYDGVGYEELLLHRGVDVIYVSLPNDLHEEWTCRALEAGKHVICEKPLGLSAASVERMTGLAERKGLVLVENIAYLHHPLQARVRELIADGAVGRLRMLRAAFGFTLTAQDNFRLRPERGGGALHDMARYPLSAALFFLSGEPSSFRGHALVRHGLDIAVQASAVAPQGERLLFSLGFDQQYECWYELVGERGRLRVDRAFTMPADRQGVIELRRGRESETVIVPPQDHFTLLIDHACGLIAAQGGSESECGRARSLARMAEALTTGCERMPTAEQERNA